MSSLKVQRKDAEVFLKAETPRDLLMMVPPVKLPASWVLKYVPPSKGHWVAEKDNITVQSIRSLPELMTAVTGLPKPSELLRDGEGQDSTLTIFRKNLSYDWAHPRIRGGVAYSIPVTFPGTGAFEAIRDDPERTIVNELSPTEFDTLFRQVLFLVLGGAFLHNEHVAGVTFKSRGPTCRVVDVWMMNSASLEQRREVHDALMKLVSDNCEARSENSEFQVREYSLPPERPRSSSNIHTRKRSWSTQGTVLGRPRSGSSRMPSKLSSEPS